MPAHRSLDLANAGACRRFTLSTREAVVVALQLSVLGLFALDVVGMTIPILGPFLGFLYVTLVPGMLLLSILRPGRMSIAESLVFAVGLSIAFALFYELALNVFLPLFGIRDPLSRGVLQLSFLVAVITLFLVEHTLRLQRESRVLPIFSLASAEISPFAVLYIALLPSLSVAGALVESRYQNPTLLFVLILLIAATPPLTVFTSLIPKSHFPGLIGSISLALLWHHTLITNYLVGWDVNVEYFFAKLVQSRSVWDPSTYGTVNSTISITILGPVYSTLLVIDLIQTFKVAYPVVFALVPVALYQAFRRMFGDEVAFLSAFLFVGTFVYFTEMAGVLRQEIAELFFALTILALTSGALRTWGIRLFVVVFGTAMVVSHYALSYIYLFELLTLYPLVQILKFRHLWHNRSHPKRRAVHVPPGGTLLRATADNSTRALNALTPTFIAIFAVLAVSWYIYVSGSSPLIALANVGGQVYKGFFELLDPGNRDPTALLAVGLSSTSIRSIPRLLFLVLQLTIEVFIAAGVAVFVLELRKVASSLWYGAMSLSSLSLLAFSVLLPYFTRSFNATRFYHVALFFLAPMFVFGGVWAFRKAGRLLRTNRRDSFDRRAGVGAVVLIVLVPYFLFSTGFVFSVARDVSTSISLDSHLDNPRYSPQEVNAARWLAANADGRSALLADDFGTVLLNGYFYGDVQTFWASSAPVPSQSLIMLRCINVNPGLVPDSPSSPSQYVSLNGTGIGSLLSNKRDLVFTNSCAKIYA